MSGRVVIVGDDAVVVRLSQLRELYAQAGDMRTLGKALGVSASTISRALDDKANGASEDERIARVRAALDGTEDGPPRAENRDAVQPTKGMGSF